MRRKTGSSGKPRTKKFSLSLIVLILIFLGLTAYFLGAAKSWDGASRLTVVVQNISSPPSSVAIPLAIFSIEPKSNQAIFISIPGNTQVDVPFGYKQFPASTVFKLGQLDNKRGGGGTTHKKHRGNI